MAAKKKIRVYYRAAGHVALWKVMEEGGFLAKHGLEMQMGSLEGQRKRAAEGLKSGDLDVVSGNHHNLYVRKALHNDPYIHIAQSNGGGIEVCSKVLLGRKAGCGGTGRGHVEQHRDTVGKQVHDGQIELAIPVEVGRDHRRGVVAHVVVDGHRE